MKTQRIGNYTIFRNNSHMGDDDVLIRRNSDGTGELILLASLFMVDYAHVMDMVPVTAEQMAMQEFLTTWEQVTAWVDMVYTENKS